MIKIGSSKQKPIPSRKRIILILVSIFIIGFISACFVAKIGYEICFQRAETPSHSIYLRYQDIDPQKYPRSPVEFISGNNSLSGYIYGEDSEKGLVVISHGLGAGAESYLSETLFFVDKGWRVFTYNNTGSHTSEGESTKGISQSVLDLKAALDYIASKPSLNALPLVLYGHSWGGYAVTSVLTYNYPISAVASVAGFSSPKEALYDFAEGKTSIFGVIGFPFFWGYHNILFGGNANISAIDGMNRSDIPIIIVHGTKDTTLRYNVSGIISHQTQITNPNVIYISRDFENQNGHSNLMFSQRAVIYANTRLDDWNALQKEHNGTVPAEIQEIYDAKTDKFLASELDNPLFESINQMFEKSIVP